jgi:hypothetical protein
MLRDSESVRDMDEQRIEQEPEEDETVKVECH